MRDIRELTDQPEAYAAELDRRWGGLLSYRYIGRRFGVIDDGPVEETVILRRDMRNPAGGILLAVLGIASPEGGNITDLEAVPNPVIHSCQVLDAGRDVSRIEIVSEGIRRGRQMAYSRSRIVDADQRDRVLALTEGQGISIGVPPDGLEKMAVEAIELGDSADLPPLWQVFGGHRRDDGVWGLPELRQELASPDAALHIGPQFVLLETAGCDIASRIAGTDVLQGVSSHVMFVARGKIGPFRVDGEPFAGADGAVAVRLRIHDEGAGDKVITTGSYVFARGRDG